MNSQTLPRIIYLAGQGRSGTTLMERLLGQLPGVWPVGEVINLWARGPVERELCGCGECFLECPFWSKVGDKAFGGWAEADVPYFLEVKRSVDRARFLPFLAVPRLRYPLLRRLLAEYICYHRKLYAAIGDVSSADLVIDSSKDPSLAFCLSELPGLDLRVVHVIRDSRAVAYSLTRCIGRPEAGPMSSLKQMERLSPAGAAMRWNIYNAAIGLLAARGTPILRVRYEDLVSAPEATLRKIAAFAGLSIDSSDFGFLGGEGRVCWADLGISHTASGNPMRLRTGRLSIRPDDAWRDELGHVSQLLVSALTLPLLHHYGYLPSSDESQAARTPNLPAKCQPGTNALTGGPVRKRRR